MSEPLFPRGSITALGVILAAATWFGIYRMHFTPDIPFDGPAGVLLILSEVAGALVFGAIDIIWERKKASRFQFGLSLLTVVGVAVIVSMVVALSLGSYVQSHYGDVACRTGSCID